MKVLYARVSDAAHDAITKIAGESGIPMASIVNVLLCDAFQVESNGPRAPIRRAVAGWKAQRKADRA
jgi:hypothetical protein